MVLVQVLRIASASNPLKQKIFCQTGAKPAACSRAIVPNRVRESLYEKGKCPCNL